VTWKTLSSRVVLKDRWIDLRADACETPAGVVLDPYYVLRYQDWVNAVAITPDDCVVMIQQYRHAVGRVVLELPGGAMDPENASPAEAAARELREETGFAAGPLRHVCSLDANPATHSNRIHTFVATGAVLAGAHARDEGEDMTVELVPVPRLVEMLRAGALGQSMQVGPALLALEAAGRLRLQLG
jgi:8-oxo-dGTP pyrophosphatase MutT (NUDIX family)